MRLLPVGPEDCDQIRTGSPTCGSPLVASVSGRRLG